MCELGKNSLQEEIKYSIGNTEDYNCKYTYEIKGKPPVGNDQTHPSIYFAKSELLPPLPVTNLLKAAPMKLSGGF
jgi:hypothetical protein